MCMRTQSRHTRLKIYGKYTRIEQNGREAKKKLYKSHVFSFNSSFSSFTDSVSLTERPIHHTSTAIKAENTSETFLLFFSLHRVDKSKHKYKLSQCSAIYNKYNKKSTSKEKEEERERKKGNFHTGKMNEIKHES